MIASMSRAVSLAQVLSTCMDANRQGCQVIRDFFLDQGSSSSNKVVLKEANEIKSVVTQADIDAQAVIFHGLRQAWGPDLELIGEEEEELDDCTGSTRETLETPVLLTNLLEKDTTLSSQAVPIKELTVFVDPLDGTREFVEGRLQNVACLIGIARKGRAIGGVIGVPFGKENGIHIYYASLSQEEQQQGGDSSVVVGTWPTSSSSTGESKQSPCTATTTTIWTGDSSNPILRKATKCAMDLATTVDDHAPPTHSILGGTAAKLVAVASNRSNSMAILHFKTCLWDTCATEALIHAKGGKVTDLFGQPLVHSPTANMGNVFGVVASSAGMIHVHNELCATMRQDEQVVQTLLGGKKFSTTNIIK